MAKLQLVIGAFVIDVTPNGAGGFDLSKQGTGRFLEINDGGGHLQLRKPGSLPSNTGLETDANGRAVFQDA